MSRYKRFRLDRLSDYPLAGRPSKVAVSDFGRPLKSDSLSDFLESLPRVLAGDRLRRLADRIAAARRRRGLIWGFGGHVVKVGLGPLLIDLMERGYVTALATNGSGLIHDFEIALCGKTSEDVEAQLQQGDFGMARETGVELNQAINRGARDDLGIGESAARWMENLSLEHSDCSIFLQAYRRGIPVTVHVAYGTDIIHNHPLASGEATGKGTQIDFQIFTHQVAQLHDGGVYVNLGSAVLLPEVFLKAVSLVRNGGAELTDFSTANLDFIQHYRPLQNVVQRPVTGSGEGIALTGHHEIMLPLLAAFLTVKEAAHD